MKYAITTALAGILCCTTSLHAAPPEQPANNQENANQAAQLDPRFAQLEQTLSNVKLVGNFTVTGRESGKLTKEEYTIISAKKLPQGDLWLLQTRIKYGDKDVALPLPLEIKWAENTPVITLDELQIPTLGTFSSRVVIDNGKYAGTWSHGEVGGHLFGVIEKIDDGEKKD